MRRKGKSIQSYVVLGYPENIKQPVPALFEVFNIPAGINKRGGLSSSAGGKVNKSGSDGVGA